MATRQEIIQQAVDECAQIDMRYLAACVEIGRQRRAALETMPPAASAYRAWEKAVEGAHHAYDKKMRALGDKTSSVEAEAPSAQGAAEIGALEAWQADRRKAEEARDRDSEKALQTYETAFSVAMKATGQSRDAKLSEARRKRDAALGEAAADYERSTDAAWSDYQAVTLKAQEKAIADIAEARQSESVKGAEAAATRDEAIQKADAALEAALAATPVAAAILEAYADRLQRAAADAEAEKAVVTARMKRLLDR